MAVFVVVVEEGGFTAAARRIGMPKSSVSRKVAELEERLGIQLLHRTTRAVRPTDVGERVYSEAVVGLAAFRRAEAAANEAQGQPRGTLRISAVPEFHRFGGVRLIDRYLSTYPDISVELVADLRTVDLLRDGYDVAIRAGQQADSTLISRTLLATTFVLCASPAYLDEHGRPSRPSELADHQCLLFGTDKLERGDTWVLTRDKTSVSVSVRGRVRLNEPVSLVDLCLAGYGIAALPESGLSDEIAGGQLERVLAPWHAGQLQVNVVFPGSRLLDPKTRAFVEMAKEHFADHPFPNLAR